MDYQVRITIKDVAIGDVRSFVDEIESEYGYDFDAPHGDFVARIFEVKPGAYPSEIEREEE